MKRNILTDDDIKKVLDSAVTGSIGKKLPKKGRIIPVVNHIMVSNGYVVTMTINDSGGIKMKHISVNNPGGVTDPAESDAIAVDILGSGYQIIPGMTDPNIFHYLKAETETDKNSIIKTGETGKTGDRIRKIGDMIGKIGDRSSQKASEKRI